MKLSKDEMWQIDYLRGLLRGHHLMAEWMHERLRYLSNKEFHNNCSNIRCTGHEGTEEEVICPKCGSLLHKLIKIIL